MNIGIAFDTPQTYGLEADNIYICDLCDLESIEYILSALSAHGHNVVAIEGANALLKKKYHNLDVIINSAEGFRSRNREALVPAILETQNLHYVGADAYIATITLDKLLTSSIAMDIGIPCPDSTSFTYDEYKDFIDHIHLLPFDFPMVLKPNTGGNSSGVFICQNILEVEKHSKEIFHALPNETVICQEFICGQEITVPVFGNRDNIEIFNIIGYKEQRNKYFWINARQKVFGGVKEISINLDNQIKDTVTHVSKMLYKTMRFRDYTRFDFRICNNKVYFIEANAFPYLGPDGAMYEAFADQGSFYDFLMYLISIANQRLFDKK